MPAKKKKKPVKSKKTRDAQRFNMEVTADDIRMFKLAAEAGGQSMSAWARQTLRKAALPWKNRISVDWPR